MNSQYQIDARRGRQRLPSAKCSSRTPDVTRNDIKVAKLTLWALADAAQSALTPHVHDLDW